MITKEDINRLKRIFAEKTSSISQVVNTIISWANINGKPTVFPPDTHTHLEANITDLQAYALDSDVVHDSGDETVNGIKTFGSFPVTPSSAPTTDYQAANKKYVDDNAGGGFFNKLDATTAPTVNDDSGGGYEIGSLWIDITNDLIYQCTDATVGAAVWKNLSSVITDDAPSDGTTYGRKDGVWATIGLDGLAGLTLSTLMSLFLLNQTTLDNFSTTVTLAEV